MNRVLALFSLVVSTSIAAAQPPPPPGPGSSTGTWGGENPGAHAHDDFYLRIFLGGSYTSMKLPDADAEVSGTGGAFGIAAGFNVRPNLIIYGEIFDDIALEPDVESPAGSGQLNGNAGVIGVGVGVAYYIQPANLYVSGTLCMAQLSAQDEDGDEVADTEFGPGISLMVGKEWWVSDNWGIGGALQLFAGRMEDSNAMGSPTWETMAVAVALSATYD